MRTRKLLIVFVLILPAITAGIAWWQFKSAESERWASQQMALGSGIESFQRKDYAAALEQLQTVAEDHPMAWQARYFQGSAQIMLKDYAAAVPLLEEALALNPTRTRVLHALGVAHFKLGNLAISKAYFARVLELDPNDEEARGLMDIMANLERMQPGQPAAEPPDEG